MDDKQLQLAISNLVEKEGLILPHGVFPGSLPGGVVSNIAENQAVWNTYDWDPPKFLSHLPDFSVVDTNASDKPTYVALMVASGAGELDELKGRLLYLLKEETRRRVILAYEASSFEDELMIRLRGEGTPAQDIERDRLRTVYRGLKTTINAGSLSKLQALDIQSDSVWASN